MPTRISLAGAARFPLNKQLMTWKRINVATVTALLCLCVLVALESYTPFTYLRTRNLVRDAIARAGRQTPPNPDLVFLAIDSDSISLDESLDVEQWVDHADAQSPEARALRMMAKHWPWSREVYALVLERLLTAGAKVVLLDLLFPTASDADEPFRTALDQFRGGVVVGSNFVSSPLQDERGLGASPSRPTETLIPQTQPTDDRVGYTNFWPDEDDVVRRVQYRVTLEQLQDAAAPEQLLSFAARGLINSGYADRVPAGLNPTLIRYTAPPGRGFPGHSLFEIFVPKYWEQNYASGEFFRGKIVLIGPKGNWQHDEHATPFGSMAGPELHLNAINAALHGEFIHEMTGGVRALVAIGAALLAIALSLLVRSPWLRLLLLVACDILDLWLTLLAYDHLNLYVPCLPFLLQLNAAVLLGLVADFTWERLEKARVKRALEKYVSSNVVRELLDNPKAFQQSLGGVLKPTAILFSDIRGYSIVSAQTDPQVLVAQLNEYLGAMVECVFRFGGTLDKFIGDAVMAVWGNVRTEGVRNDTANAVRAALAMQEELARLNREWRARGLPELRIGIAVNQGDVVVGNIGSPQRMEFTVIGDVVNVTWRLQELTKTIGADLIVSENVTALLVEDFELQSLGEAMLAGRSHAMEVFSVLGAIDPQGEFAPALTSAE